MVCRFVSSVWIIFALGVVFFSVGTVNLFAQLDKDPPIISDVVISSTTATSTVISWKTDEDADALVQYGLDEKYGVVRDVLLDQKDHSITLTNLLPSTVYHVRIVSTDATANQGISSGFKFKTEGLVEVEGLGEDVGLEDRAAAERAIAAIGEIGSGAALGAIAEALGERAKEIIKPPSIIGDPRVEAGIDSAVITWVTDIESNSLVAFAAQDEYDPSSAKPYTIVQGQADESVLAHSVEIVGLEPATIYHYQVSSQGVIGPPGKSRDAEFTTKAILPEILDITLQKIQEESVTISITTSVPTSALIEYTDEETEETLSKGDPTFLATHSIQIDGLTLGTAYSAIVRVRNEAEDEIVSDPIFFVTVPDEEPPTISTVNNESTLFPGEDVKIQTIVSWDTDEPSVCAFFYQEGIGPGIDPESTEQEVNPTLEHVQVLTSLLPSSVYKFWIECNDRAANFARSEDFVLVTPTKEKSIIDIILENFEGTFGWVKNITK